MRSDRIDIGPLRILRHRVPPEDVDPYGLNFNQHNNSNYPRVASYAIKLGKLSIHWDAGVKISD
jgi:hypothetical protein